MVMLNLSSNNLIQKDASTSSSLSDAGTQSRLITYARYQGLTFPQAYEFKRMVESCGGSDDTDERTLSTFIMLFNEQRSSK